MDDIEESIKDLMDLLIDIDNEIQNRYGKYGYHCHIVIDGAKNEIHRLNTIYSGVKDKKKNA